MLQPLEILVDLLSCDRIHSANVIPWSSPVPSFGDNATATVATVGLNPSNREFVDETGNELSGKSRRFHTLTSLGLRNWEAAGPNHCQSIAASCRTYFETNPYNAWFGQLDDLLRQLGVTYYGKDANACHLDLVPFATHGKWTSLSRTQRQHLYELAGDSLGLLVRDSKIRTLVLNGRTVVDSFVSSSGINLERRSMSSWRLNRRESHVEGEAFYGVVDRIGGTTLGRRVQVLGFNHNIQSSFGVTISVRRAIGQWLAAKYKRI